jgi:hypothetical protein
MTLAQVGLLIAGERLFHDPKAGRASARPDAGTGMDLMMFGSMKVV